MTGSLKMYLGAIAAMAVSCANVSPAEEPVRFNRDIRPIIADQCFTCHGPDNNARKASLRFDTEEGLFGATEDGAAILVPGDAAGSELYKRMTHDDPDMRMPPAGPKPAPTQSDIELIKRWIEEGAPWEGHWSFISAKKPDIPEVSNPAWCNNEIDYFILRALDDAGLEPSPEAAKETLIRRVTLDLTGLPPTIKEVDAFMNDNAPGAYERLVDRLLASPQYGERMAFIWLDAARYSDTNGYQRDTKRYMWHWRDWVIDAFNENMPYDEFAIEQLAGDMLPNATIDQRIATGFSRNHRINGEGGIIPEEYAVEYVVDRVITTGAAFMGMTFECARCHDHKFDPFSQREFYELYAFFNNVPEKGKGDERGNDVPELKVPSPEHIAKRAELSDAIAALESELNAANPELDALQAEWEADLASVFGPIDWQALKYESIQSAGGAEFERLGDGSVFAGGTNPDMDEYAVSFVAPRDIRALRLDVLPDDRLSGGGPGRSENGNLVLTDFAVERTLAGSGNSVETLPVAHALADYSQPGEYFVRNAIDNDPASGWATNSHAHHAKRTAVFVLDEASGIRAGDHITVRLKQNSKYQQHTIGRFKLSHSPVGEIADWAKPKLGAWRYVGPMNSALRGQELFEATLPPERGYDAGRKYGKERLTWVDRPDWKDGVVIDFENDQPRSHFLHRTIHAAVPMNVKMSFGSDDGIKVWVDGELKLSNNTGRAAAPNQDIVEVFLTKGDHDLLMKVVNYGGNSGFYFSAVDDEGSSLLTLADQLSAPVDRRTNDAKQKIRQIFRRQNEIWIAKSDELNAKQDELAALEASIPTTMVMEEMETPRDTYLLRRGIYDQPDTSEKLSPSVPAALGEMDESLPKNRLGFAQWLVDPDHPLTARVRVNLYWQTYFGRGIVKTSEDFGTQGTAPTHPDLLDWLATQFIESGWDVKGMQKTIVMSATYRQQSHVLPEHMQADPENKLLARAPRFRLPAEMIRDQALKVSGLLNDTIGGPSVYPYQPDAMWSSLTFQNMDEFSTNFYTPDTGDKLYRRGLYTYWKRTIPPPRMQIFNAAGREMCSMRQETTNTPMQALNLLNDPTYVEASRHLAERMIREGGDAPDARVRYGYRLALAGAPDPDKASILTDGLTAYREHFAANAEAAKKFIAVGDSTPAMDIPATELAAYTMLASVILNLDETITRE